MSGPDRLLDARLEPLDAELRPFAKADQRAVLLDTIPGVAELLALTIAVEVGEISRFAAPEKLVSYGRLAPRVHQSGQARPRSGPPRREVESREPEGAQDSSRL